ncbi:RluA family pseudouridine synthase [Treponema bryantii]|uniref:RluA family pseudouridine synthase n=1 Tax=Treponema bryantii TaxID=163 RepID=UPI0003B4E59F|nr:RluA family pseudouridine synthase [Treponema bryantii]
MQELKFSTSQTERLDEFLRRELPAAVVECAGSKRSLSGVEGIETTQKNEVPVFSNSKIRRLILAGAVQVNSRPVLRPAFELRGHSNITVRFEAERFFYEKQPDDLAFEMSDQAILYEDENLIFVNKPADFPVEQTITGNRANLHDALVDYLWKRNPSLRNPPYVGIMHRLDRTTSGVIMFTKTRTVNKEVSEIFQSHNLTKQYLAVVEAPRGTDACHPERNCNHERNCHPELDSGSQFTVEMFMGRINGKSQQGKWGQLSEARGGQYSKTDFRVLKPVTVEGRKCLLIECSLYTGRTHQIRVHLASRGLPILGDTLYGGARAKRLYLHANHLSFTLNDKNYDVSAPLNL